jgi:hypothetical protein
MTGVKEMYRNEERVDVRDYILTRCEYDPEHGEIWLKETEATPRQKVEIIPASDRNLRGRCVINKKTIIAARAAYLIVYGDFPKCPIVSLNGDTSDIRWSNLWLDEEAKSQEEVPHDEEPDSRGRIKETNRRFIADLKKHHPNGCIDYTRKNSKSLPKRINPALGSYSSTSAMCMER